MKQFELITHNLPKREREREEGPPDRRLIAHSPPFSTPFTPQKKMTTQKLASVAGVERGRG